MSRHRTPQRPCQQLSLRKGAGPHPPMRDGWRAWNFCNRPTTHVVRWPWSNWVWDAEEQEERPCRHRTTLRVCAVHARRIERYQHSIGWLVGVYRYRSIR